MPIDGIEFRHPSDLILLQFDKGSNLPGICPALKPAFGVSQKSSNFSQHPNYIPGFQCHRRTSIRHPSKKIPN